MKQNRLAQFHDQIYSFFSFDEKCKENESFIRNITLQVTEDCPLACTYCYEKHKSQKTMSEATAKSIIDLLFQMYDNNNDSFINHTTKGLIIDLIGGEGFLNVKTMDFICDYFINQCLEKHHPWLLYSRFSISSNGVLYFQPEVQKFINKYKNFISLSISIDGPQEIHDACRVYSNGKGSFEDANKAEQDFMKHFPNMAIHSSKATIAPENLKDMNKILHYFIASGKKTIYANTVYEAEWTIEHAKIFYNELKQMANYLLELNDPKLYVAFFDENFFSPLEGDNLGCWCGGAGKMLAFDPDGNAYPCLRYMPMSLGDVPPVIIGSTKGIYKTQEEQQVRKILDSIDRRTKNDDECFYCPIASGCADCEAWNYQSAKGQFNIKNKNICWMHRARALANYYYWNKYYLQNNINKRKEIYIEENIALQIISKKEWDIIKSLS